MDKDELQEKVREKMKRNKEFHNMNFLVDILKTLNLNKTQIGRLTTYSQQLICWWIKVDDASLYNIVDLFSQLGYNIECQFKAKQQESTIIQADDYSIEIDEMLLFEKKKNSENESILYDVYNNNQKLKFVAEYIINNKLNIKEFSELIKVPYHTVYRWFRKDDIKIKHIYTIAEVTNNAVTWKLTKK